MPARAALLAFALAATCAAAQAAEPVWPPPASVEARMHELQGVLISREATREEREAARQELANLIKSPAGQARPTLPLRRAAIEPTGPMVKPAVNPPIQSPGVAELEVVVPPPPRPVVVPQTGTVVQPTGPGNFAVNPITGSTLHPVPNGYVDPRTGQFVPR